LLTGVLLKIPAEHVTIRIDAILKPYLVTFYDENGSTVLKQWKYYS